MRVRYASTIGLLIGQHNKVNTLKRTTKETLSILDEGHGALSNASPG